MCYCTCMIESFRRNVLISTDIETYSYNSDESAHACSYKSAHTYSYNSDITYAQALFKMKNGVLPNISGIKDYRRNKQFYFVLFCKMFSRNGII